MGKNNNSIQTSLWQLLNENRHLKELPVEVKHLISSNVSRSFKQYRKFQVIKLVKEVKGIMGKID